MLTDYIKAARIKSRGTVYRASHELFRVFYARFYYRIGPCYYSLFGLSDTPISEWKNYILDRESNPIVRSVNRRENIPLAVNKILFAEHLLENDLPTIPILFVIHEKDAGFSRAFRSISDKYQFFAALDRAPDRMFAKLMNGAHGEGAFSISRLSDKRWRFGERTGSGEELFEFCQQRIDGKRGLIVQPAIRPHSLLNAVMGPNSLGTVRAITYLSLGGPKLMLPLLRMPAGGNVTDNFSEGAAGNIVAKVDIETGVLGCGKMARSKSWPEIMKVDRHPDTGVRIRGFQLPYWQETISLMLNAQASTPQLRTLGWDIAITDKGPIIVEANTGYDANLLQVAYGRGVRGDLAPIFDLRQAS